MPPSKFESRRQPKDFDQMNPPKDVTNPDGPTDTKYPAHVHKVNETGEYVGDYRVVTNDDAKADAIADGYYPTVVEAIAAFVPKAEPKKKGKD